MDGNVHTLTTMSLFRFRIEKRIGDGDVPAWLRYKPRHQQIEKAPIDWVEKLYHSDIVCPATLPEMVEMHYSEDFMLVHALVTERLFASIPFSILTFVLVNQEGYNLFNYEPHQAEAEAAFKGLKKMKWQGVKVRAGIGFQGPHVLECIDFGPLHMS